MLSLQFTVMMILGFVIWITITICGFWLANNYPKYRGLLILGGSVGGLLCYIIWIALGAMYLRTKHLRATGFEGNNVILDNVSAEFAHACLTPK